MTRTITIACMALLFACQQTDVDQNEPQSKLEGSWVSVEPYGLNPTMHYLQFIDGDHYRRAVKSVNGCPYTNITPPVPCPAWAYMIRVDSGAYIASDTLVELRLLDSSLVSYGVLEFIGSTGLVFRYVDCDSLVLRRSNADNVLDSVGPY